MAENPKRRSAVIFWIVVLAVLAIIVVALWDVFVTIVGPFIDGVRDAYF